MSDVEQDTQAPVADTPEQHDEPSTNWEKRYTDLQPEYTRASQEAAKYRGLVERAQSGDPDAIRELGFELDTPEEDTSYGTDPNDERISKLEQRLEAQVTEAKQQAQLAQMEQHVERELSSLEGLDDKARDLVVRLAVAMDPTENGMPDIKAAHAELYGFVDHNKAQWAKTKRAPHVSPNGQAGTSTPDIASMDKTQKAEYMAQRLASLEE